MIKHKEMKGNECRAYDMIIASCCGLGCTNCGVCKCHDIASRKIGVREIEVSGKPYYEVYYTDYSDRDMKTYVGDLFSNSNDAERNKQKLYVQLKNDNNVTI